VIKFLLQEIEKNPNPLFTKKELLSISPKDFQDLTNRKILAYCRPSESDMEKLRLPRCQHGCPLTVVQVEERLEAVCLEHPEEDPIPIEKDDLNRYAFSVDMLLVQLRAANRIDGDLNRINGGYFYIGYKTYSDNRVGFIFISNIGKERLVKLSGLRHLCKDDDVLVALTPASKIEDVPLKGRLRHDKIVQTSLVSSLDPQTFELPIEKMISGLLKSKEITELSKGQKADYAKFEYQCYDKVYIPGTIPMKRSNLIVVNQNEIKMGDSLFILFLRFVAELKKRKGGWVNIYTLESEGIITDILKYQVYSNLRTALKGSLLDKDGQKFIESDGSKNYRISTHPDFITYDKRKLLNHQEHPIRELAKKLP
jgi:hypothetical protein